MTTPHTPTVAARRNFLWTAAAATATAGAAATMLAGCSMPTLMPGVGRAPDSPASRGYRRAVAAHLYDRNSGRIFKGQLPAMLYAIGVLQVDIDRRGQVARMHWLRAPSHAPEVVVEIERIVRQSAPYPAPSGTVTYTDTWLWDQSGRFQLDTLSEGQL
jgi:periplasmic protein TonB